MKRRLLFSLIALSICLVFIFVGEIKAPECVINEDLPTTTIFGNNKEVQAEVVTNGEDQALGLGNRDCLYGENGMLFEYALPGDYCFWMKDMRFDIDMIWLDDEKKIVTIKENVKPSTYPDKFCPDRPAQYVLEVNSGYSRSAGWQVGDYLQWQ